MRRKASLHICKFCGQEGHVQLSDLSRHGFGSLEVAKGLVMALAEEGRIERSEKDAFLSAIELSSSESSLNGVNSLIRLSVMQALTTRATPILLC